MHLLGSELFRVEPACSSRCVAALLHSPTQYFKTADLTIEVLREAGLGVAGNAAFLLNPEHTLRKLSCLRALFRLFLGPL